MTTRLEQQLAKEQATRLKGEEVAQLAQRKSNDEIHKLKENLERAQRETEDQMHESYEDQIKRITEMVLFMIFVLTSKYNMHMCSFLRSGNHF